MVVLLNTQFYTSRASERRAMILVTLIIILVPLMALVVIAIYLRSSIRQCTSEKSMKGKVVIVTGANAGIGFHTSMDLARRGARVILACRHAGRGAAAQAAITADTGNRDVVVEHLDLSSLKSVRDFAAKIIETEDGLHVLVNNAGVYGNAGVYTEDGIIETMQVNYFGHFLLTLLLLPLLKKSKRSRIVNVTSILHFLGHFNPDTVNSVGCFFKDLGAYCKSKFCMLMFTIELSRRLEGSGVVANAVHPGVIMTGIASSMTYLEKVFFWCWTFMDGRTVEQGAQTVIHLAVSEECEIVSGKYFVDCSDRFKWCLVSCKSRAAQLWSFSAKIVGINHT